MRSIFLHPAPLSLLQPRSEVKADMPFYKTTLICLLVWYSLQATNGVSIRELS